MSPTIRVDDAVYSALQSQAVAFVDTPNAVLRRILGLREEADDSEAAAKDGSSIASSKRGSRKRSSRKRTRAPTRRKKKKRTRAPSGSILPEPEYEVPLLEVLDERGGSAAARETIKAVGDKLRDRLTALDQEELDSGGIRWMNRVQFVRLALVRSGDLSRNPGRGVWAISEQGRQRLEEARGRDE